MNEFFWGVLPYIAFTVLIGGTIARYVLMERGWTTKSSEFLSKNDLKIAGPMFHLGLFMALGGHIIGVLIPKVCTEAAGINEHLYHIIALAGGIPAGILFFFGFLLLLKRRFLGRDSMQVNTSRMDRWLYVVLFLAILTGCAGTLSNALGGFTFDYRVTISPWFRSLLAFSPDVSLMEGVPFVFRAHMLLWMVTAILFPFTRLVHCLSFPFLYLTRSPIVYRRKESRS